MMGCVIVKSMQMTNSTPKHLFSMLNPPVGVAPNIRSCAEAVSLRFQRNISVNYDSGMGSVW